MVSWRCPCCTLPPNTRHGNRRCKPFCSPFGLCFTRQGNLKTQLTTMLHSIEPSQNDTTKGDSPSPRANVRNRKKSVGSDSLTSSNVSFQSIFYFLTASYSLRNHCSALSSSSQFFLIPERFLESHLLAAHTTTTHHNLTLISSQRLTLRLLYLQRSD